MDSAIKLYDHISDTVSDTFPQWLKDQFQCAISSRCSYDSRTRSSWRVRLFITKKRYAINVLDLEGWQPEGGKLKVMGLRS